MDCCPLTTPLSDPRIQKAIKEIEEIYDVPVENLPVGDRRLEQFYDRLHEFILDKGNGLPFPSVLGTIDLVKAALLSEALK